jgi:transposase IS4-like protein/DDE family transposase
MPLSGFWLGQVPRAPHLADQPLLEALRLALPDRAIDEAIAATGARERRRRLLPARLVVALVIGMGLWAREGLRDILINLVEGLRAGDPQAWAGWQPPRSSGALTQARQRLGPRPLRHLFQRLAGPVAAAETPGAWLYGRRVLAIDGVTLDLPDTVDNARIFGRPGTGRGEGRGAFPQLKLIWLVEVGSHVLCDAVLRPGRHGEHGAARQLLRSVGPAMLVELDCGLYSHALLAAILAREADFLARVGSTPQLAPEELLADGSFLTTVYADATARRRQAGGVLVRVLEYELDDPARPGRGRRYRLVTSLLDPCAAPAEGLAAAYHERWEIEGAADELKTHQLDRRPAPPIRSKRPREVVQEVYGLLLAHLAVRLTMYEAATAAGLDPDRLSFTGTLRILRRAVADFQRGLARPDLTPFLSGGC